MKKPFFKTLNGKFVSRTVLLAVVIALLIGGLAVASLRSLNGTANASVAYARDRLPQDAVDPIEALASDISAASSRLTLLLILITVIGAIAAGALALVFARQITSPIVRLRNAAMKSATALPEIVEASANGDEQLPELPSIVLTSGDEVEDLAQSFNVVQRTAAELAVEQARMRRHNDERFVNLGRRSQNLLARQMSFIDAMEKDETNPANLKRLFQIDHLATRMRRNAESVLVLADEGSPRHLRGPVSMHQVVQAASGEIEHFDRIAISAMADTSVDGSVAHDLAHLLAELLENATSFAPPETATTVSGIATGDGYLLEITDHGIGMEEAAMAAANARFADQTGSLDNQHSPSYLGHDVVARLARRHGVAIELMPTPTGGVTARLHLPSAALSSQPSAPTSQQPAAHPGSPAPAVAHEPDAFTAPGVQSAALNAPAVPDDASMLVEPDAYTTPPLAPDDASSLEAFTPEVPDDASALVEPDPFIAEAMPNDDGPLDGFTAAVPDDVSSLIEPPTAFSPDVSALAEPEPFVAPLVPDDASSLTELTEPFAPRDQAAAPAFEIPTFDDVLAAAPVADFEPPAFDPPTFEEVVAAAPVADFDAPTIDPPAFDEPAAAAPVADIDALANPAPVADFDALAATAAPAADFDAPTIDPPAFDEPAAAAPVADLDTTTFDPPSTAAAPASVVEDADVVPEASGLSADQQAAIDWAMSKGGGSVGADTLAAGPVGATTAAGTSELRPGPIDAATLSELETTPSGFVHRREGEDGANRFSPLDGGDAQ